MTANDNTTLVHQDAKVMTPAMYRAMAKAGVYVPQNQRVWNYIRDNADCTTTQIASALKLSPASVATLVRDLADRNMVNETAKFMKIHRKDFKTFERYVLHFSINPRCREFDLAEWPVTAQAKQRRQTAKPGAPSAYAAKQTPNKPVGQPVPQPQPQPAPAPEKKATIVIHDEPFNAERFLSTLSLGEARQAYDYLKKIFG